MQIIVFDTETGDKVPGSQLLQVAYLVIDTKDFSVKKAVNKYIKYPVYRICKEAAAVNHLSAEFLDKYGEPAEQVADEIYADFRQASVCGFCVAFDVDKITTFFRSYDYPTFEVATVRDCKKAKGTLIATAQRHNISDEVVKELTTKYFGDSTFNRSHDATFDTVQTYLLAQKLAKELDFI